MAKRRRELALEQDGSGRFLPWLIALMVYLACLALAGAVTLSEVSVRWGAGLTGTMTIQIAPHDGDNGGASGGEDAVAIAAVLDVLHALPGVASAHPLPRQEIVELIEPWLGRGNVSDDLPVPTLIEVSLKQGAKIDSIGLAIRLEKVAPGTRLDDHGVWIQRLARLSNTISAIASAVVLLIGIATAGTVVFATRAGLAVHIDVIETLHVIGARNDYIARQFQARSLSLALRGGLLGLVLAVLTVGTVAGLAGQFEGPLMPRMDFTPTLWGGLAALPLAVSLIATITARMTVLGALRRMP